MNAGPAVAPIPLPEGRVRALVYGGSFDPPHRGHLTLPALVRDAIGADLVVYVPAARSPHKTVGPEASDGDRLAMLRAGLAATERCAITTFELDARNAEEPSYTVRTLEAFASARPEAALRLLIGVDQALAFHRWREAQRIIELAPPAVMLREGEASREGVLESLRAHWDTSAMGVWAESFVDVGTTVEASSTRVRELLRTDRSNKELAGLLTAPVRGVIDERGLYR